MSNFDRSREKITVTKSAVWLPTGLPDFFLPGFAQGLTPSMVRATAVQKREWKFLQVFPVGRFHTNLGRRFVDYGQTA